MNVGDLDGDGINDRDADGDGLPDEIEEGLDALMQGAECMSESGGPEAEEVLAGKQQDKEAAPASANEKEGLIDCPRMKTKELREFLAARGLKCQGCAEKSDYVTMCEEHKDTPELAVEEPPADGHHDEL